MRNKDSIDLAAQIIELSRHNDLTLATAESCTGGWIAKSLTDIPGSSSAFKGGLVAYHNQIKEELLGVKKSTLIEHGAVSAATAFEMAKNCAQCFGVDLAISVTGIAGPGGGSKEKPVGLVFMGYYFGGKTETEEFRFEDNGRNDIRRMATMRALEKMMYLIKL